MGSRRPRTSASTEMKIAAAGIDESSLVQLSPEIETDELRPGGKPRWAYLLSAHCRRYDQRLAMQRLHTIRVARKRFGGSRRTGIVFPIVIINRSGGARSPEPCDQVMARARSLGEMPSRNLSHDCPSAEVRGQPHEPWHAAGGTTKAPRENPRTTSCTGTALPRRMPR
jgi:hypothetical protein